MDPLQIANMRRAKKEAGMFDISDAYGRGIRSSLGKLKTLSGQGVTEGMNELAAVGGNPEQMLRFRQRAGKDYLTGAGDVLSEGNLAQANAIFGATEERNAMAEQMAEAERQRQYESGLGERQRGWDVEDRVAAEKLAKKQMVWNLIGQVIQGGLPLLGMLKGG